MLRGCMFRVKWLITVSCFIGESRSTSDLQLNLPGLTLSSRQMNIHTKCISHIFLRQSHPKGSGFDFLLWLYPAVVYKLQNKEFRNFWAKVLVFTWLFTCTKTSIFTQDKRAVLATSDLVMFEWEIKLLGKKSVSHTGCKKVSMIRTI